MWRTLKDTALEDTIQEIYEVPLTSEDSDKDDDLEGRFLAWLARI